VFYLKCIWFIRYYYLSM